MPDRDVHGTLSPSEDFTCCEREDDHAHEFFFQDGELIVSPPVTTDEGLEALRAMATLVEVGEFDG